MTAFDHFILKMVVLSWLLLPVGAAPLAADYSVRQVEGKSGECFSKDKRVSNARFCHNCKKSGGDRVVRKFRVYCEGKPTEKIIPVVLFCKKSIPKEGKQSQQLYETANDFMEEYLHPFYSFRECKLGGWTQDIKDIDIQREMVEKLVVD